MNCFFIRFNEPTSNQFYISVINYISTHHHTSNLRAMFNIIMLILQRDNPKERKLVYKLLYELNGSDRINAIIYSIFRAEDNPVFVFDKNNLEFNASEPTTVPKIDVLQIIESIKPIDDEIIENSLLQQPVKMKGSGSQCLGILGSGRVDRSVTKNFNYPYPFQESIQQPIPPTIKLSELKNALTDDPEDDELPKDYQEGCSDTVKALLEEISLKYSGYDFTQWTGLISFFIRMLDGDKVGFGNKWKEPKLV